MTQETLNIIRVIFEIAIVPLLGILVPYFIKWLQAKSAEIQAKVDNDTADKYIQMITDTVVNCVIATNQTYVESLKADGKFDLEAQKVAFQKTLDAVLAVLSEDSKKYISTAFGDVETYLTTLIESAVNANK